MRTGRLPAPPRPSGGPGHTRGLLFFCGPALALIFRPFSAAPVRWLIAPEPGLPYGIVRARAGHHGPVDEFMTAASAALQPTPPKAEGRSPFVRTHELLEGIKPGKPAINLSVGEPQHP